MKNLICLLIIGLSFFPIIFQNRVERTEFKIKNRKIADYKTDYRVHYAKRFIYFLDGKKYNGVYFENWGNGNLNDEFEVKNSFVLFNISYIQSLTILTIP